MATSLVATGVQFPDNSVQTTAARSEFASGTLILFQQSSAPTGWTKQTTHNDKALRVVSGSVSSGGTVAFTTAFASQTPAGSVSINTSGLSAGATTLSTTQIPSHAHSLPPPQIGCGGSSIPTGGAGAFAGSTGSTGGGGSHNHSISGSATGTFTGTAIDLSVQYVDVIIASKD